MLLAVLVPALLFAGGAAFSRLGAERPSHRIEEERTLVALARAKEALMHYALADPNRPGELPCPDLDGDGRLMLAVDFRGGRDVPCATRRGWLPVRSLGVDALRDGTGERLWYAVSDPHHAGHSALLNSDTPGPLRVGDAGDVVAVVIAPGRPVNERQARERDEGGAAPDARRLAPAFLEGANADAAPDRYASRRRPQHEENDRLLPITRRELFAGVEKRVLGEVARTLVRYFRHHGALPWLVPLDAPEAASAASLPGTRKGRLPLQRTGEVRESARLHARWELSGARMSSQGSVDAATLSAADLRLEHGPGPAGGPECRFVRVEEVDCVASERLSLACHGEAETAVARTYRIRFAGEVSAVAAPDDTRRRRRSVSVHRADAPGPISAAHGVEIAIDDVAISGPRSGEACGSGAIVDAATAWGFLEASEVDHPLVLDSELPAWFADEGWSSFTYVAYAAPVAPSAAPRGCDTGVECLVLDGVVPAGGHEVLVVIAGPALSGQDRGSGRIDAWFEGENATLDDDVFTRRGPPGEFNDQVRRVVLPR